MTGAEARKKRWESLKDKPLKDKLQYIFTYYWPGIVGALCVLIFLGSWIGNILMQKDTVLSGHLINGVTQMNYTGNFRQEYMDGRFDTGKEDFSLTADTAMISDSPVEVYEGMNALATRIAVGEIDFLVSDLTTCAKFTAYLTDLRDVLSEAQLTAWQDLLVYVEKAELDKLLGDDFEEISLPEYHLTAEGMEDPLPIGIRLPENCKLLKAYSFPEKTVIFGFTPGAPNVANAIAFLEYILS